MLLPGLAALAQATSPSISPAAPAALAALAALSVGQSGGKFPPPDAVFHFKAITGARQVRLSWTIRDGYYLYRKRIHVAALSGTTIGALALPKGVIKVDPYFGRERIYREAVTGELTVRHGSAAAPQTAALAITYQGCADAGLCYPPITKTVTVAVPKEPGGSGASGAGVDPLITRNTQATAGHTTGRPSQARFVGLVRSGNLLAMLGAFYLSGLALAFTPCCLPMIPILSGLIAGGRRTTTAHSLLLSCAYVLGMAFTYTLAGIAAAAAGGEIQAAFQQPWIVGTFAALLAAMGLAMLGLYSVQMPAGVQTRLSEISNGRRAGTVGGVAAMGALSALIVTTCVAPALVGALVVIGQSGEVLRGGAALFALSIGMGTPLLAVGASAGRLLPKAGLWMDMVKKLFGAAMLAVAVWMLSRVLSGRLTLALWAAPVLAGAWTLWTGARHRRHGRWPWRTAGALAGAYALALLGGAALGGIDTLAPVFFSSGAPTLRFKTIHSVTGLQLAVARAARRHEAVMVDFYANWCTSCKEMEATTFSNNAVRRALAHTVLLRADVTTDDAADQALLRYFGIYGPPTIAFYDREGHEQRGERVVGYLDAAAFLQRIRSTAASAARPPA